MKYLVIDPGFMQGRERNPVFSTNSKKEAVRVADESGAGYFVIRQKTKEKDEKVVYISPFENELELAE